jgi:hypothetical protein
LTELGFIQYQLFRWIASESVGLAIAQAIYDGWPARAHKPSCCFEFSRSTGLGHSYRIPSAHAEAHTPLGTYSECQIDTTADSVPHLVAGVEGAGQRIAGRAGLDRTARVEDLYVKPGYPWENDYSKASIADSGS